MSFVRKIYYLNKPLILTNDAAGYQRSQPAAAGYLSLMGAFPRHYRLAFEHLEKRAGQGAIIEDLSIEALLEGLYERYEPIDAAGGVVRNEAGSILMIYRRGKWDLPKGKLDDGEDISACALREVSEETGLQRLQLGDPVCDTYHIYSQRGQHLLKRTAWYHMTGTTGETLQPQTDENIEEARWVEPAALGPIVFKSYEAIREVLSQAGVRW